jgi:hypothetical protein
MPANSFRYRVQNSGDREKSATVGLLAAEIDRPLGSRRRETLMPTAKQLLLIGGWGARKKQLSTELDYLRFEICDWGFEVI